MKWNDNGMPFFVVASKKSSVFMVVFDWVIKNTVKRKTMGSGE